MISLDDQYSPEELKKIIAKKNVARCNDCAFMFTFCEEDDPCPFCGSLDLTDIRR